MTGADRIDLGKGSAGSGEADGDWPAVGEQPQPSDSVAPLRAMSA